MSDAIERFIERLKRTQSYTRAARPDPFVGTDHAERLVGLRTRIASIDRFIVYALRGYGDKPAIDPTERIDDLTVDDENLADLFDARCAALAEIAYLESVIGLPPSGVSEDGFGFGSRYTNAG